METTNLKLNVTNLKSIFPSGNGSSSIMGKSGSRFIPRPSGRGGTIIPPEGIKRRKRRKLKKMSLFKMPKVEIS